MMVITTDKLYILLRENISCSNRVEVKYWNGLETN